MNEQTLQRMSNLKLFHMADKLKELIASPKYNELDKEDLLAYLVDNEYQKRRNNRVTRLLREAQIRFPSASIEDWDFKIPRGLTKDTIRELSTCRYLDNNLNVLISGPTGSGKTFLASALASKACENQYRTKYRRVNKLLEEIRVEKATGNYLKAMEKIAKYQLLLIDDLGPDILNREEKNIFMEVVEERYLKGSNIVVSQLPFEQWYDLFNDPATADAVCDRLFHNAIKITLKGESMRKQNH